MCGKETQIRLHKIFRPKISDWKKSKLIDGAVLTYHFYIPRAPTDSLYVCLNIPSVKLPRNRSKLISEETAKQIPEEIKETMKKIVSENLTDLFTERLETIDYEFELTCNNAPSEYGGAPIEEILEFASIGTEIALEILDNHKTKNKTWENDKDIADAIIQNINKRLTTQRKRNYGLHFVCNPLSLWGLESYLLSITNRLIDQNSCIALKQLYKIES